MPNKKQDISKCKHPNSRKTKALAKGNKRLEAKQKNKFGQALKQNIVGEKVLWFQEHLLPNLLCYSADEAEELIQRYLIRFNDELEQITLKHSIGNRKNRQHASREDIINLTVKREREEYNTCGLEIPDLMNSKQLELLKNWNGELRFLQNFKLARIGKKHIEAAKTKELKEQEDSKCENEADSTKAGAVTMDFV